MSISSSILTPKVTLKLLIDKKNNKVVFAEAGKDFVDFLLSIPSFPLGTVIKLLASKDEKMEGSLGNLCQSIQILSDTLMRPNQTKDTILNPEGRVYFGGKTLYLAGDKFATATSMKLYICRRECRAIFVANDPEAICPICGGRMEYQAPLVSNSGETGFVKGLATYSYMVMDDLEVKPMSGILGINLLNELKIPAADFEERVVEFGLDEGLALVKASLLCKTVLTKVFLGA
ncbi:hypothetical protein LINGRAHAP2_LOCUS19459 [Linum grandiflorum]